MNWLHFLLLVLAVSTLPRTGLAAPTDTLPDGEIGMFLPDSIPSFERVQIDTPSAESPDTVRVGTWANKRATVKVRVRQRLEGKRARFSLSEGSKTALGGHEGLLEVGKTVPAIVEFEYVENDLAIRIRAEPSENVSVLLSPDTLETAVRRAFSSIVDQIPHRPHPAPRAKRYVHTTVNLRSGPGTGHSVIRQLSEGDSLWVSRHAQDGWRAVFNGEATRDTVAWIYADLVHIRPTPVESTELAEDVSEGARNRRDFADRLERRYLERGMDVSVSVRGEENRILRVQWVLAGRPEAYQLQNNHQLMNNLDELGFKKFELTDGYGDRWSWSIP